MSFDSSYYYYYYEGWRRAKPLSHPANQNGESRQRNSFCKRKKLQSDVIQTYRGKGSEM